MGLQEREIPAFPSTSGLTKGYISGAHRLCDPAETLERIIPHLPAMGITRIADVTGLDRIGIPVYMAVRPNSRVISVSQGKGITPELAKVSAAMESIEAYHAENIYLPVERASFRELNRQNLPVVDPARLVSHDPTIYHPEMDLFWLKGTEMLSGQPVLIPFDTINTDFTTSPEAGLSKNSNGLASGNHLIEAVSHAICEVVERDAAAFYKFNLNQPARLLNLNSVNSIACQEIFSMIHQAGLELYVLNITHEISIPTFKCFLIDPSPSSQISPTKASGGSGTHLSKEIALLRAVTEAIQSRLTYIAGSRDDINRSEYLLGEFRSLQEIIRNLSSPKLDQPDQDYAEIPSLETDCLDMDVQRQLELLQKNGVDQVIMVDLTKPEFDIPVVKVVIPGMEFLSDTGLIYHKSERAVKAKLEQIMSQLEELME